MSDNMQKNNDVDLTLGINCLGKEDILNLQVNANENGTIVSFRQTNSKATNRLAEGGYPKRIDNHAKSSEQDALITCNAYLSKLSRDYKKAETEKEKNKILEKINNANIDNLEIIEKSKIDDKEEKEELKKIFEKAKETKNQFYTESLKERLEYINGQRIQIPKVDTLEDEDKELEIFYLKKKDFKGGEYPIEIDNDGDPVLYAEKDGKFYKIKIDKEGKKELTKEFVEKKELENKYTIEKREVFSTVEYNIEAIMDQVEKGNYEIDINEYRVERKNTADYDQLFVANNNYDFLKKETQDGCFKNKQDEQLKNIELKGEYINNDENLKEYLYNYNYFQITDPPNKRINEKIDDYVLKKNGLETIIQDIKDINNFILNQKTTDKSELKEKINNFFEKNKDWIEKDHIKKIKSLEGKEGYTENFLALINRLEKENEKELIKFKTEIKKLKSLGMPNITTETLIKKTNGVINHGPETYHYYPEGFKKNYENGKKICDEIIVTVVPEKMIGSIETNEKVRKKPVNIEDKKTDKVEEVNLFILEGLEGVVNFVNNCKKKELASIEINPLWSVDVDLSKNPTELVTIEKPILSEEDYKTLNEMDKNLINKILYAERLRLQPDNLNIPEEISNIKNKEKIRTYIRNNNLIKVMEKYSEIGISIKKYLEDSTIPEKNKEALKNLKNQMKTRVKKMLEYKLQEQSKNEEKFKNNEYKILLEKSKVLEKEFEIVMNKDVTIDRVR